VVRVNRDGTADVLRNGRQLISGLPQEDALAYIRRRRKEVDQVSREDLDGQRTDITKSVGLPRRQ
jgi:hypothetical protein